MTKKSFVPKGMKKFVKECVIEARNALCANEWDIETEYHKDPKKTEEGNNVAAEMVVDKRYLQARLKIYPVTFNYWKDGDKDGLRCIVFHEVSHIWTEHMKDLIWAPFKDTGECTDAWEALTSRIANLAIGYVNGKK